MQSQPKSNSKVAITGARQRWLNLIYFIDANETKSLKIKLNVAKTLLFLASLGVVWFVVSFFVIAQLVAQQNRDELKIRSLLATVFDYQTRHDAVYENAYDEQEVVAPVAAALSQDAAIQQEVTPATSITANSERAVVLADSGQTDANLVIEKPLIPADVPATDAPISIESARIQKKDDRIEVNFTLKNNLKNKQSQGHFWGVAEISTASGEESKIASPDTMTLSQDGKPSRPSMGFGYRISYFTNKDITFLIPNEASLTIKSIELSATAEGKTYRFLYTPSQNVDLSLKKSVKFKLLN